MKIFSSRYWRPSLVALSLISALLIAFPTLRHHYYYPVSDKFINPYNGKENPEFAKFLTPLIAGGEDMVEINLGDVPADVIKVAAFQYLSPIIRMNPQASQFRMTWNFNVFHYYADAELHYNRTEGTIVFNEVGTTTSSYTTTILGKDLTDRDIHQAACSDMDYDVWAEKHWKK